MQRGTWYLIILIAGLALMAAVGTAAGDLTVTWNQTYGGPDGGEAAYAIAACPDGAGFYLAGEAASSGEGGTDVWVVRLTPEGDEVWNRTYGGREADTARSIIQTGDGDLLIAGNLTFVTDGARLDTDAWLIKIDPAGAEVWNRTYGGPDVNASANAVIETDDGGSVFAGSIASWGGDESDAWVVRLNETGGKVWERKFGGAGEDRADDIVQLPGGDFVFAGSTGSTGAGGMDAWVVRLNGSGGEVWNRTFGGLDDDDARAVITTTDGNLLIAGTFTERSNDTAIDTDALLMKLTPDGDIIWNWIYGDVGVNESANAVVETYDGGYVFAGATGFFGTDDTDAWLVGVDDEGAVAWSKTFGGINPGDRATSLLRVEEAGYIFAGVFNATEKGGVVNEDAWAVRLGVSTEPVPAPPKAPIKPPKAPAVHHKPPATGTPTQKPPVTKTPTPAAAPASIGGIAWNDTNADGVYDSAGEPGIAGVSVTLRDADLRKIGTTETRADGRYSFTDLTPGDYVVEFKPPEGMVFTVQVPGGSDVNQTTGRTGVITLKAGEEQLTWDAGLIVEAPPPPEPGLVTGTAWFDIDGQTEVWDESISGIPGVRVELMRADGTPVNTTLTGPGGTYTFYVDEPGDYFLRFAPPRARGAIFVLSDPANDVDPETGTTDIFEVVPSGTVTRNVVLASGSPPLTGTIWCDLNKDGIWDPGEPGIPGVRILRLNAKPMLTGSTITDSDGSYHFSGCFEYWHIGGIQVYLPDGYSCTTPDPNSGGAQADWVYAWIETEGFTEIEGETLNVGLAWTHQTEARSEAYGWVHGMAWHDKDRDGVKGETYDYLAGIEVQLLDSDGAMMASTHTREATTFSGATYLFGPLTPGEYSLVFIPLEGYTFTDPGRDSQVDPATGRVGPFTVGGNE
ncbi:MAG: SdrD B-like domain-containing protein, partial [Methanoculleus sp.]